MKELREKKINFENHDLVLIIEKTHLEILWCKLLRKVRREENATCLLEALKQVIAWSGCYLLQVLEIRLQISKKTNDLSGDH